MNLMITIMVTCQPGQSQMSVCPLWCPLSQWEAGISNHYLGLIEFFFNSKSTKFDVFKSSHWMVSILSWSPPTSSSTTICTFQAYSLIRSSFEYLLILRPAGITRTDIGMFEMLFEDEICLNLNLIYRVPASLSAPWQ